MAYSEQQGFPAEFANKIGHMRLIQDSYLQRMIESFESTQRSSQPDNQNTPTHIDLTAQPFSQIITVDGGTATVPNLIRSEKQMGFIQVAAHLLKLEHLDTLRSHPMMDPREVNKLLGEHVHHIYSALPLAGVRLPNQKISDTIRESIRRYYQHYELQRTLTDLMYRSWHKEWDPAQAPFQECVNPACDAIVRWDIRWAQTIKCPKCGETHFPTDYLGLLSNLSDEEPRHEIIENFRSVTEALTLFTFVLGLLKAPTILNQTLFLLDGPLLLRANLYRLVEPIRDLIQFQKEKEEPIFLTGIEKGGAFRAYVDEIQDLPVEPGDFILPTVQFITEHINGTHFDPRTYRNRVNYGAKLAIKIGKHHTLALNIPTGDFILSPTPTDTIGLERVATTLAKVASFSYSNALIPVVLVNQQASISLQPSGSLLESFIDKLLSGKEL